MWLDLKISVELKGNGIQLVLRIMEELTKASK